MSEEITALLGFAVILFFIWRFLRTHQLYRFSKKVLEGQAESVSFEVSLSREFAGQVFLGNRNVEPKSFFARPLVYSVIALILWPFKDYAPNLYWIIVFLVILYTPWCLVHGILLRGQNTVNRQFRLFREEKAREQLPD